MVFENQPHFGLCLITVYSVGFKFLIFVVYLYRKKTLLQLGDTNCFHCLHLSGNLITF